MASATLREIFALHHAPKALLQPSQDDLSWMEEDPDLAPFLASSRRFRVRPETPLEAFA